MEKEKIKVKEEDGEEGGFGGKRERKRRWRRSRKSSRRRNGKISRRRRIKSSETFTASPALMSPLIRFHAASTWRCEVLLMFMPFD